MPEFAEVLTIADELTFLIKGKILKIKIPADNDFESNKINNLLKNCTIVEVFSRGKYIVFTLDSGLYFIIHLGMTGRLSISNEVIKHEKFTLKIRSRDAIVNLKFSDPRGFGRFFLSDKKPKENFIDPREKGFYSSLKSKIVGKERAIFLLLLDQSIAFGVGSYLAQETLFYAGIRPERNFLSSEEAEKIAIKLKSVIALSVEKGGATMRDYRRLSGKLGRMQDYFKVYGLYGNPCIKCSTMLSRAVIQGRGVTFCSRCQI